MEAEGVELVEGRMFEQAVFSSMVVARPADVGMADRSRVRGAPGRRPPIELVVEDGFDGAVGPGADFDGVFGGGLNPRGRRSVNGAAIFLKSGAGKFPSLAGWRSAVGVIGFSVFCRPAATLEGRWNGLGGGVRLEADVFRQKVGVLAQPIARPFDLDNDSVVKQSVEKGRRHDGVAEDVAPLGEAAV